MDEEPINRRWITPAQWMAARALSEGAHPTRKRVAAALGCDDSAVYARAALEEWTRLDFRSVEVRALHEEMMEAAAVHGGREPPGAGPDGGGGESGSPGAVGGAAGDSVGGGAAEAGDGGGRAGGVSTGGNSTGGNSAGGGAAGGASPGGVSAIGFSPDGSFGEAEGDGDPVSMLATASRFVSRQLARLMARADRRGGRLDKRQIDGLAALARMMERWETLATERAKEEETESDDEIAELLEKINDRIVELARAEAARLVAAGYRPEAGAARG